MAITSVRTSSVTDPQRFQSLAQATYIAPVPSTVGMVLLKPTSIAHAGTSASIGANGQVTFTGVTSLSLNGVFSADFDNYVVSVRYENTLGHQETDLRLRVSGSDATGTDYTSQLLQANGTSVTAGRSTSRSNMRVGYQSDEQRSGETVYLYGPFLTQPTAARNVNVMGRTGGYIVDYASTHSLSTSYDGFTLFGENSYALDGALQVYGVRS